MGIEIHRLDGRAIGKRLFHIDDELFREMKPALELYRKRTGLVVDPFGTLKMSSGLKPLIACVTELTNSRSDGSSYSLVNFQEKLIEWDQQKIHIILIGD